ncbi:MAG: iron-containing alcohol dehydrogenase [Calditrichaceae bacterium]
MADYFEFFCPVKIVSGDKALENIPFELDLLSAKKPMIVTDKGVSGAGLVNHIINAFKESNMSIGAVYDDVPPDSSLKTVREVSAVYRKSGCDALIAIGGGSVMDTAKAVNIVVSENADDLMQFTGAGALKRPLKPLIAVPTTAGTGSEVTIVAIIADTDKNIKLPFTSYYLLPNIAVIDPRMTMTMPAQITAATGMDALTHSIEAYTCLGKNPMSDAYATSAIRLISKHLLNVVKNPSDKKGRLAMANAATMAGIAFSNSMVGMVHTLGHSVGAVCHIPHGTAMSILLPHVLEYNHRHGETSAGELLLYLAGDEEYAKTAPEKRVESVIEHIRLLKNKLYDLSKLPRTLEETGKVAKDKLEEIAKVSLGDASSVYNPVEIEFADALDVLQKAYDSI